MSARFWAATFCCVLGCLPVVGADSPGPPEGALLVYTTGTPSPSTLPFLRAEAESLMQSAGYNLEWREPGSNRALDAPNLVVLQFVGDCAASPAPVPASEPAGHSLASATVQEGSVLPFARVDCAALRATLAPMLAREAPARRAYLYGRAMGRLIAHELYHVLARTRDHVAAGIGKPCFTAADLVAERFEFEAVALSRLRRPVAEPSDTWFESSGRQ